MVYLAVRRHGTSTINSTRVFDGSGPMPRVAAAVNERGDALAAWTTAGDLQARVRTLGGRMRPVQRVGAVARGSVAAPSVALSAHRGELVGWVSQPVHEGDAGGATVSASQARDGGGFSAAAHLADIPAGLGSAAFVGDAGIRVAFDPGGRRLLTWTGYESGRFVARSAEMLSAANSGRADLADTVLLSDPAVDTVLSDLEVTPSGQQLALLDAGVRGDQQLGSPATVLAVVRAAGASGAFASEVVSDGDGEARSPDATIPGDGRALAIWSETGKDDQTSLRAAPLP